MDIIAKIFLTSKRFAKSFARFLLDKVQKIKTLSNREKYIGGIHLGIRKNYILKILAESINKFLRDKCPISQIYK